MLKVKQNKAKLSYQDDIEKAWGFIDEKCASIAEAHGKSYWRVQYALHMGHRQLSRKVHNKTNEWNAYLWKKRQEGSAGTSVVMVCKDRH